jgi:signal transduction histidine kinase
VDLSSGPVATLHCQLMRYSNRLRLGGDALIAVSLAALTAGMALAAGGSSIAMRLGGVLAAFGLLVLVERRGRPLLVLIVAFAVVFVEELAAPRGAGVTSFLAIMVAAYSLGAHAPRRVLAAGAVLGIPGVVIGHSLGQPTHYSDASADVFFYLVLIVGPVLVGRVVQARLHLASRLRGASERLAATRSERLAAEVAADRARLTEQIDTVLVERLGRIVALGKCETLEEVSALEHIAREALGRLRALVGELRAPERSLEPGRPLADVRARVARAIESEGTLTTASDQATHVPRRWALIPPRLVDAGLAILAVLVAGALVADTVAHTALRGPRPIVVLLGIAIAAPIAWARRSALAATAASIAATFAYVVLAAPGDPESGLLPTGMLIVFPLALGATTPAGSATVGLALCLAAAELADAVDPAAKVNPTTAAPGLALIIGTWTAGRILRDRSRMLSALADTAIALQHEHKQLARSARAAERARVARELHDAVAHAMTVIVLQAGAARRVWESDPDLAHQHAGTLHETVSELITELRATALALDRAPDASVTRLERLIERARSSGLHVELDVTGDRALLNPALQQSAYRVLQEALTNAARHAPGTDVDVRLAFAASGLTLEVSNQCPMVRARTDGSGHGLRGMRERVESCGGRLAAGPEESGRFAVRAWLPCP